MTLFERKKCENTTEYLSPLLPELIDWTPAPLDIEKLRAAFVLRRADIEKRRRELEPLSARGIQLQSHEDEKQRASNASAEFRTETDEFLIRKYRLSETDLQARKAGAREDLRAWQDATSAREKFEEEYFYLTARARAVDDSEAALEIEQFLLEVRADLHDALLASAEARARQAKLNKHREHRLAKHLPQVLGWPDGVLTPIPGDPRRPSASTIWGATRMLAEASFQQILQGDDPVKPLATNRADWVARVIAFFG